MHHATPQCSPAHTQIPLPTQIPLSTQIVSSICASQYIGLCYSDYYMQHLDVLLQTERHLHWVMPAKVTDTEAWVTVHATPQHSSASRQHGVSCSHGTLHHLTLLLYMKLAQTCSRAACFCNEKKAWCGFLPEQHTCWCGLTGKGAHSLAHLEGRSRRADCHSLSLRQPSLEACIHAAHE